MAGKDYYQILGVERNVDDKDLKAVYRRLARQYHPDVNPGNKAAEERFKEINQAYEVLADVEKRKKYDRYGEQWQEAEQYYEAEREQEASRGFSWQPGAGQTFHRQPDDIENNLHNNRREDETAGQTRVRQGQDAEYPVELTLEEAFNGAVRNISVQSKQFQVKIPAGVNNGSRIRLAGKGPAGDLYLIISIQRHSLFRRKDDDIFVDAVVPLTTAILGGTIQVPTINGTQIAVKIPPETQNEQVFRLVGHGMPHLGYASRGDMMVTIKVTLPTGLTAEERTFFTKLKQR